MCPGVLSDWPSKCPVCNMALVRRTKGGPVQLPDGVVSRMQYSPYRLQLAGVRTAAVSYRPLTRDVSAFGFARASDTTTETSTGDTANICVDLQLTHADAALLRPGQAVEISCIALPGQGPWSARVGNIDFAAPHNPLTATVTVDIDNANRQLSPGMEVCAQFSMPIADIEPFRSQPTDPEPLLPDESRSVFVCPEHGDVLRAASGKCPRDGLALAERPLAENERVRYWCPMHPNVTARESGQKCAECAGMVLVPRVIPYRPPGEVLAAPENAVIDTGSRHVVYVDRGDGMFDGVEVVVGPRADGYCSIVSGLVAGEKVASAGAFLLDAETRLNPNTSAAYFGATTNPAAPPRAEPAGAQPDAPAAEDTAKVAEIDAALSQLAPDDERLARRQRLCPVTQLPLGSMGTPEKRVVNGRIVFLCCAGCEQALLDNPDKYLTPAPAAEDPK
jgi:hypothetical protein